MLRIFTFLKSKLGRYIAFKIIIPLDPKKYFENSIKFQDIPAARWIIKNFNIKIGANYYGAHRVETLDFLNEYVPITRVYLDTARIAGKNLRFLKWLYGKLKAAGMEKKLLSEDFRVYTFISCNGNLSNLKWLYTKFPEFITIGDCYMFNEFSFYGHYRSAKWVYSRLKKIYNAENLEKICEWAFLETMWSNKNFKIFKWLHNKIKNVNPCKWFGMAISALDPFYAKWIYKKYKDRNVLTCGKCKYFILAASETIGFNLNQLKWYYKKLKKLNLHGVIFAKKNIIFTRQHDRPHALNWLCSLWRDFDDPNIVEKYKKIIKSLNLTEYRTAELFKNFPAV